MKALACFLLALLLLAASPAFAKKVAGPSRPPVKGCAWERVSDRTLGLEAWVQRCDFGFRKIDFVFEKSSLAVRYSDGGGKPDPVVDVLDLRPAETAEAGIRRLFAERTSKDLAGRCVLAPYREGKLPARVRRFTFVPDRAFRKELDRKADPNEVPDPPCGDWGTAPDGIQYFEAQPGSGSRKVLFVRVGQDEPLFDETTLRLLPPR
ncbi:MAG TPA: hypothetical protein VK780_06070 [Thermoanaerobaculia bacterium]|jgi:hypothetical protein|nr:hypothetical protein [Thermoanaerobaculia bacterium]